MRNNPNKIIKVITQKGEEYRMFLTGKYLALYLLVFETSARYILPDHPTMCELHAPGQSKNTRFFCDRKEIEALLDVKGVENG